jgi:hypothetical protein
MQNSHSLNNIHLRFSAQDRNRYFPLPAVPTLFAYSRYTLFSVATKLTILNYDLSDIAAILSIPIFHTLRALAVVDYPNGFYFYMRTLELLCLHRMAFGSMFKNVSEVDCMDSSQL